MANDSQMTQEPTVLNDVKVPELNEKKEVNMRRRLRWLVLLSAAIVGTALYHAKTVLATPGEGFVSTTLAVGRFGKIDVLNYFISDKGKIWLSSQNTKGKSDLYVQSNVWQPGGHTGWHTHPGHSLITVTAGTVTAYEANDPSCKPHVYYRWNGVCRSRR